MHAHSTFEEADVPCVAPIHQHGFTELSTNRNMHQGQIDVANVYSVYAHPHGHFEL